MFRSRILRGFRLFSESPCRLLHPCLGKFPPSLLRRNGIFQFPPVSGRSRVIFPSTYFSVLSKVDEATCNILSTLAVIGPTDFQLRSLPKSLLFYLRRVLVAAKTMRAREVTNLGVLRVTTYSLRNCRLHVRAGSDACLILRQLRQKL